MSAKNTKGGGGAAVLTIVLAAFLWSPSKKPRPVEPQELPTMDATRYHVMRFYGAKPKASKKLLELEVESAAKKHGLKPSLLKALVKVESGFNPNAVSRVGARGAAQIMPFNSKRCGLRNADELWDPVKNLRCGAKILKEELRTYGGDLNRALQSYNGGPRCINRCRESIDYARNVLALSQKMKG